MGRDDDEALAREREWQEIVDNFGERAVLGEEDVQPSVVHEQAEPTEPTEPIERVFPDDEFVPPTPPPIPRPPFDRLLAWLGVFGIPAGVLVCIVAGISVPTWFGLLMAAGFLGGFGYLVIRMSDEPRDPWDDGAVL